MLDSIDLALLAAIEAHPGQHMAAVLRDFERRRTSQSCARIKQMAAIGLVELDRTREKGRVFVDLTDAGRKMLAEAGPCTQ